MSKAKAAIFDVDGALTGFEWFIAEVTGIMFKSRYTGRIAAGNFFKNSLSMRQ